MIKLVGYFSLGSSLSDRFALHIALKITCSYSSNFLLLSLISFKNFENFGISEIALVSGSSCEFQLFKLLHIFSNEASHF